MSEPIAPREQADSRQSEVPESAPRILCLGGTHDAQADLNQRFGSEVEIVEVSTPVRALAQLSRGDFIGVYADADHISEALSSGNIVQNERILQHMPDGVVLLSNDNTIIWGNGRLCEWTGRSEVEGFNLYEVLGRPEILGPDFCPFHTAISTGKPSASTLRCEDGTYYRIHAAPVIEGRDDPQHLIVTLRDITEEMLEQQKIAAIHQAGIELSDLTTEEVASMDVDERIDLLKANILHCTQHVLQFDVVEIRMLDQETGVLLPLLAVGMKPEAESRKLLAETTGNGVTGFVAATGKSYLCEDTSEDPVYIEGAQDARSSLTVPIVQHEQVLGTLNVESPEPQAFSESDLQFLEIFARDLAAALNTLEILAAERASTAAASVEAIHSAVALPVDEILNDAVHVMESYIGHEPEVVERIQRILRGARDIKQVIQKVGQTMAPIYAQPAATNLATRPQLVEKRILVVDDDNSVRSAAHALLERYQCIVETAHNGSEAQYMVRNLEPSEKYDVIIADIRLPDMSGYDLLMKFREMLERVPLVLMSGFGYDPEHSIPKARQVGLRAVLYKPFRLDQLLDTVEQIVNDDVSQKAV